MRHGPWPGTWKVVCDVCGFQFHSGVIKKRWDGLMVCDKDYELDHPQKFIRVREDSQTVPFVRTEPDDVFVHICTLYGASGEADRATADCARADIDLNLPS